MLPLIEVGRLWEGLFERVGGRAGHSVLDTRYSRCLMNSQVGSACRGWACREGVGATQGEKGKPRAGSVSAAFAAGDQAPVVIGPGSVEVKVCSGAARALGSERRRQLAKGLGGWKLGEWGSCQSRGQTRVRGCVMSEALRGGLWGLSDH